MGSCYGPRLSVTAPVENLVHAAPHEQALYGRADTPTGKSDATFDGSYGTAAIGATSSATPVPR